jgi:hypothetical protein
MEKDSVLVILAVEKEPSAIAIEDPKLIGIEAKHYKRMTSLLNFDLPKLHMIPESYQKQIKVLVVDLLKEIGKRGILFETNENDDENQGDVYQFFMTLKMYEDFYVVFEEYKAKYDHFRDKLVSNYDQMVSGFLELYQNAGKEKTMLNLKSIIPTKEQFTSKFKLNIDKMLTGSFEEQWERKFIGKSLQNAFALARYLDKFTTEELTAEAINVLSSDIDIISGTNISNDKVVEEVVSWFRKIQDYSSLGSNLGENPQFFLKRIKQSTIKLAVEIDVLDMIEL